MKIRILRSLGTGKGLPAWTEGQEVNVTDAEGKKWIEQGVAEAVSLRTVAAPAQLVTDAPAPDPRSALPVGPAPETHHEKAGKPQHRPHK